jgi:hypothetical protein
LLHLNFGEIILLPRVNEENWIQQYRHICILNASFEIFTKVATIRLNSLASHVVRPSHTTFMQERNILDVVVILNEMVHKLHRKKLNNGVILNLILRKPMLRLRGLSFNRLLELKDFLMISVL